LAIKCRVIVAVFDCLRQIIGTRRRRRWYQLRRRQTPLSSVTLYYVCSLRIAVSYRYRLKMTYLV